MCIDSTGEASEAWSGRGRPWHRVPSLRCEAGFAYLQLLGFGAEASRSGEGWAERHEGQLQGFAESSVGGLPQAPGQAHD